MYGQITSCRVCGASVESFFDLSPQPLANSLLKSPDEKENFYPLELFFCSSCSLVQLGYTVDPKILFTNYVWVTGTSKVTRDYADRFRDEVLLRAENTPGYVLEVASNDGTFLKPFQEKGCDVLGIDPAENIAEMANKAGVPTEAVFWGKDAAEEVKKKKGPARIAFARNVLPHVANTRDFVEGLATALDDKGMLVIEIHYAKAILEDLHYDSIYHEHLCYFTLKSLEKLLNDFGLFVFDITTSPINAGNIAVYAKKEKTEESQNLLRFRNEELEKGTNELTKWQAFASRSLEHHKKLLELLKSTKGSIVGWGASARSSTMLNFANINPDTLPAIIDMNPLKQGLYTAGTHIPIVDSETGMKRNPECVFILAWTFADEIKKTLEAKFGFKGECIIPLPGDPKVMKTS